MGMRDDWEPSTPPRAMIVKMRSEEHMTGKAIQAEDPAHVTVLWPKKLDT